MTRTNLVDAYDNRSVVAKLVNMEERISGAETSAEASAEAAATSASAAAVSLAAAKTSEANAKASADTAAATLSNTVDLSSKQTVTGAKTFAGDTTVTGQLISSGTNTLSGTTELEGTVELDSTAVATLNGKVTASNTGNSIKVANHDTALISNDVLSAKDINEVNGSANNLLHRSGDEVTSGSIQARTLAISSLNPQFTIIDTGIERGINPGSWNRSQIRVTDKIGELLARYQVENRVDGSRAVDIEAYENTGTYYGVLTLDVTATGTVNLILRLVNLSTSTIVKNEVIATLSP